MYTITIQKCEVKTKQIIYQPVFQFKLNNPHCSEKNIAVVKSCQKS
jgi:hypothetical protein